MPPLSFIEISKSRLIGNVKAFRKFLGSKVKIAAVIKANAYGHGQNEAAKILEPYADYFQVDDLQELVLLRKVSPKPALVLGYVAKKDIREALINKGIISIYDKERMEEVGKIAASLKIKPKIHIKIDANLGRQGILLDELDEFLEIASKIKNVNYGGVYSHFANLEDTADNAHALKQIKNFNRAVKIFKKYGFGSCVTHISATSGALLYEKNVLKNPLVRIGLGLYGMWPSLGLQKKFEKQVSIRPVMRWVTHIAQIKTLPKDYTVGYGLTYKTKRPTKVAVIPQGYSDGYDRGLSNRGEVLVRGKRCRILGRLAMNMFVVDLTNAPKASVEDEVVLLGAQKSEMISAEEIAEKIDTINYEITTRISSLLPRIIV